MLLILPCYHSWSPHPLHESPGASSCSHPLRSLLNCHLLRGLTSWPPCFNPQSHPRHFPALSVLHGLLVCYWLSRARVTEDKDVLCPAPAALTPAAAQHLRGSARGKGGREGGARACLCRLFCFSGGGVVTGVREKNNLL